MLDGYCRARMAALECDSRSLGCEITSAGFPCSVPLATALQTAPTYRPCTTSQGESHRFFRAEKERCVSAH